MDTTLAIHTSTNRSVLEADGISSPPAESNRIRRGATASYRFRNPTTRLTVEDGETVTIAGGETERIDFVEVFSTGTLIIDGTLICEQLTNDGTVTVNGTLDVSGPPPTDLEFLAEYREFAGQAEVTSTLDSTQKFSESIGSALDTLVIGIEPSDELQFSDIPGVWGVVESISDGRNQPLTNNAVEIEVSILAPYSEYNSITDVTNNLKIDT